MTFDAYLFDLDGVLVDSYDCWWSLLNEAMRELGREPLTKDEFDASWGQGPEADQGMFFPSWTVEEVIRHYETRFAHHARWVKAEPGAEQVLRALKQQRKKLAVASNSPTQVVELLLKEAGLHRFLDVVVGVDQVKMGKPSPEMIFLILRKLEIRLEQACYVGDSVFDEQAASAAGIFFIGYKRPGKRAIAHLEELIA